MIPIPLGWLAVLVLLSACAENGHQARITMDENGVKTAVYLSPKLTQEPGTVANKSYFDIDFPRGHIAIKSFNGELVDDGGSPIPLHQTYMHHWLVTRNYVQKGQKYPYSDLIIAGNSGVCTTGLSQNFGVGSETRKTDTYVPDPYGIEFGNPDQIPHGYEEIWVLVIHAIDTRGVQDKLGCTECRCNLYNVTADEYGGELNPNYEGGFHCCYDKTQCRLKERYQSVERKNLYMRYTVKWVDWDHSSIIPVKIYIYDVTDTWNESDNGSHDCPNEYHVEPCSVDIATDRCIDTKRLIVTAPSSGDVIYGVGHQHIGGTGVALYGEEGRVLCSSVPIYGEGNEAGNEAGYIVGMSTCYPQPGSVKIYYGETIVLESNYSSSQKHTGVMGLFYILVAEQHTLQLDSHSIASTRVDKKSGIPNYIWIQVMFGVVISTAIGAIVVLAYLRTNPKEDRYQSLVLGE